MIQSDNRDFIPGENEDQENNLINKNETPGKETGRQFAQNQGHNEQNVDPLKPHFERSNLNADREKRAGSGGSGLDPDRDGGDR